ERHHVARGAAHVDLRERLGALPVLRGHLHHDVVLVERRVDRRDLALAEGVVERLVDHLRGHADARGAGTVDLQRHLEPAILLVVPRPPPPPVKAVAVATAGSVRTISTKRTIFSRMAWNDTSCAATRTPAIRPLSCCGKNPLGITTKSQTFTANVMTAISITMAGCRSVQESVLS